MLYSRYGVVKFIRQTHASTKSLTVLDSPILDHNSGKTKVSPNVQKTNDCSEYLTWSVIGDPNAKVAILLRQGELIAAERQLLPRHAQILGTCLSYWKKNFTDRKNTVVEHQSHLNQPSNPSELELKSFSVLKQALAKVYASNCKLIAFADTSVAAGEYSQFLRLCNALRRESKTNRGLLSGKMLVSPKIYETLACYFANKADWLSLDGLLKRMEQDGITVTPMIYVCAVECLGRLLALHCPATEKSTIAPTFASHFPNSQSIRDPVVPHKLASNSKEIVHKIEHMLHLIGQKAESQGVDIYQQLLCMPRAPGTIHHVLLGLERIQRRSVPNGVSSNRPERTIIFPYVNEPKQSDRIYPVEKHLNTVQHRMRNAFAGAIPQNEDLLTCFERQLALECKGEVRIPPVLPPYPMKDSISSFKKPLPNMLKKRLRHALLEEQSRWRIKLLAGFKDLLQRLKRSHTRDKITVYPFLKILPAPHYVDLMIKAIDNVALNSTLQHVSSTLVCMDLGRRVQAACELYRKEKLGVLDELKQVYTSYAEQFNREDMPLPQFRHMWLSVTKSRVNEGAVSLHHDWPEWTPFVQYMVGRALYSLIYDKLKFDRNRPILVRHQTLDNLANRTGPNMKDVSTASPNLIRSQESPLLFEVFTQFVSEMRMEVKIHPTLANWYRDAEYPPLSFHPAELPMLCPPVPWTDLHDAGYLVSRNYATRLMRQTRASPVAEPALDDDLDFDAKRIPSVLDALNCLASCPWRVNEPILDALIKVARAGGSRKLSLPEIVRQTMPSPLSITNTMSYEERRAADRQAKEAQKQYDEMRSLWATELYRLSIANQYRGRVFWFPHSMDFRGRVYPCPPHFHHMGSDVSRGLIVFAKGLPLGEHGLDWLKIHLVNLTGLKKRCSNRDRLEFAEQLLDDVLDSARNPFNGRRWWQEQEEPWQVLACCKELMAAIEHPSGPHNYISHFPVHQDGSCNGLQHYAALGRDCRGAESVNLTARDQPQDVYSDVAEVVEAQRQADAAAGIPVAKVLEGFVRRKVIKQSVMTTVYGVTLYGASEQIRRQLRDLEDFPGREWIGPAGTYLARLTLASIGAIFTSSTEIQAWFGQIAHHISRHLGSRVSWETPLGLPVTQPYMTLPSALTADRFSEFTPSSPFSPPSPTLLGASAMEVASRVRHNYANYKELPVPNPVKQQNAFPPNFIHSLDSCHMMLTALHCFREGITFASVHDCFWTHAATVNEMNRICREEFIALHSEPILTNFADYLRSKFAYTKEEISEMNSELKRAKASAFNEILARVPKPDHNEEFQRNVQLGTMVKFSESAVLSVY
ncbi:DNA-directed RNA polymerase [Opisthorchis viverrini]|uniref:DNA-directed RNA polymerase n=1 Tax=Opisthorchis viverrini TaxID=6198 RepID=A0A1S8XA57_OPIVI|nr:DNA-directed RNA polymerase [Opisthorchis viverrini]